MEVLIKEIFLSIEDEAEVDVRNSSTDVIITLENEAVYVASFYTYANIKALAEKHKGTGDYQHGSYFWVKNMLCIESCERANIEKVIQDLIDEGNFLEAFRKL